MMKRCDKMKVIIFAAGMGKRLWPLTAIYPKPFIKVFSKPLIKWQIDFLIMHGIKPEDIGVVINPEHVVPELYNEYVHKELGKDIPVSQLLQQWGVHPIAQKQALGTAHALWQCREFIGNDDFGVMNGDHFIGPEAIKTLTSGHGLYAVDVEDLSQFGAIVHEDNKLVHIHEKSQKGSGLANLNFAHLPNEFINYANPDKLTKSLRGEFEIVDSFINYSKDYEFLVKPVTQHLMVSYPWDLIMLHKKLLPKFVNNQYDLKWLNDDLGKVFVQDGSIVHETAEIKNSTVISCYVGPNSRVGPYAYVRHAYLEGLNQVGPSEVKVSVLMKRANAPHYNRVGDSVLCEDANLGGGAKIANLRFDNKNIIVKTMKGDIETKRKTGSFIGARTKVGMNAGINCGTLIAPNSKVMPLQFVKDNIW